MAHLIIFERRKLPPMDMFDRLAIERKIQQMYRYSPLMATTLHSDESGNGYFVICAWADKQPPHKRHKELARAKKYTARRNMKGSE